MQQLLARLIEYVRLMRIEPKNILEMAILAYLIYQLLKWVKNTRTWFLLRGIGLLLVFVFLANIFELNVLVYIADRTLSVLLTALLVIFSPELRQALEQIGQNNYFSRLFGTERLKANALHTKAVTGELVKAAFSMSKSRTGALIVIEREIRLDEYIKTGIEVDAATSSALLINIFEKNTPLHDGAVIMRGGRVVAATCYLPLSTNPDINKSYGTRHRAAIGISEVTDSLTIIVSEETGEVSFAVGGKMRHNLSPDELRLELEIMEQKDEERAESRSLLNRLRSRRRGRAEEVRDLLQEIDPDKEAEHEE
ncbi:MAG: diadenylate cyclase CdaA [Lachnospiraceae bacterium]|nr:diadenylate cyclase CdaA [Lachnospiraceae bacterium]